nr:MAG TPA: hypothetical protein [Caudoviricetes sp.]
MFSIFNKKITRKNMNLIFTFQKATRLKSTISQTNL